MRPRSPVRNGRLATCGAVQLSRAERVTVEILALIST